MILSELHGTLQKMLVLMFSPSFNIPFHRLFSLGYIHFIELIILITTVVKFALRSDQGVNSPSRISIYNLKCIDVIFICQIIWQVFFTDVSKTSKSILFHCYCSRYSSVNFDSVFDILVLGVL